MKKIIMLAGLPGTGKSYYALNNYPDAIVISSDEIRIKITGTYAKQAPNMFDVYNEMIRQANEIKEGTIILDSTFLDDNRRDYFLDHLVNYDEIELIMLKVKDINVVFERNKKRIQEKWVPEDVILEMNSRYSYPSEKSAKRFNKIEEVYVD